ncbi:hypothetical protein K435DRAFT_969370 [Dendrothele bispora CBS 962.96]|uniref:Uncharacterized protein n=1 Tax=Dendrothele bispora (strain CBS 962.96) TaxID=1314807 RepID=A0A4S8LI16_DENBC|nr:hypothetical protein K435DRAFT_969370 [Dendrothele bispora CBS 962.96]
MLNWNGFKKLSMFIRLPSASNLHLGHRRWKTGSGLQTKSEKRLYQEVSLNNQEKTTKGPGSGNKRNRNLSISTLDCSRLRSKDLMDFSNLKTPLLYFNSVGYIIGYTYIGKRLRPFPPNTRGFLYFHQSSTLPSITKSIRLRLCEDPSKFNESQDLLAPDGNPWDLSLFQLMNQKNAKPFVEELVREGYITEEELELCRNIMKNAGILHFPRVHFLHALGQSTSVRIGQRTTSVAVMGKDTCVHPLEFNQDFLEPFTGIESTDYAKIAFDYDKEKDWLLVRLLELPEQYRGKTTLQEGDTLPLNLYRFRPNGRQNARKAMDILVPESKRQRR